MNQTKIEWCDVTVNPVVGCTHGCSYCYARRQAKRQKQRCQQCYDFNPHPHLERLFKINPNQKTKKIFINSMWDWCCDYNETEWLHNILFKMNECSQHTFQILTKKPERYKYFDFPDNVWLGTTITIQNEIHRAYNLINGNVNNLKFICLEPLHSYITDLFDGVGWVIIGAETGNRNGKITPEPEWIEGLIWQLRQQNIPIFLKDNLNWHEEIKEFPK